VADKAGRQSTHKQQQWLKWFCEAGGGAPDEAGLEQTPQPQKGFLLGKVVYK